MSKWARQVGWVKRVKPLEKVRATWSQLKKSLQSEQSKQFDQYEETFEQTSD